MLVPFLFMWLIQIHAEEGPATAIAKISNENSPSVVNISTANIVLLQNHRYWGEYGSALDGFFNRYSKIAIGARQLKSLGSGVIVSKDGLIVTNAHAINMSGKIYATLNDKESYKSEVIRINQKNDLALIKISVNRPLKPIEFGPSPTVGEAVVSMGNPHGLESSASSGIVKATGVGFNFKLPNNLAFENLIETDAAIDLGTSGGALLDLDGKLVGINLAILQKGRSLSFAIPIDRVKEMLKEYETSKGEKKNIKIRLPPTPNYRRTK